MFNKKSTWIIFVLIGVFCTIGAYKIFPKAFPILNISLDMSRLDALEKASNLTKEFNDEKYSLDFVVTSATSTPKLSVKVDGKRFSNLNIQKKQLSFSGTQKSPKWSFKQIKVGNLLFGHAKKFSFDEENKILSGVRKYINILTSNKFNTLSEEELDGCILIIKESEKHRLKPPSKEKNILATLIQQAESGDQEAIERLKEMISVNYVHQLTSDEIR